MTDYTFTDIEQPLLRNKVPHYDNDTYKKMVDYWKAPGFAIPMGDMITRGKDAGMYLACVCFYTKEAFDTFVSRKEAKYLGLKWNKKIELPRYVLYKVAKKLRNREYKDVGMTVVGDGFASNPERPERDIVTLNVNEVIELENMIDGEFGL